MENVKQLICSCEQYLGNINKDTKEVIKEDGVVCISHDGVSYFNCPSCGKTTFVDKEKL